MQEYWRSLSVLNKVKFVTSVLLGILAVIFATLNWKDQEVHLIVSKRHMPLTMVILFSMLAGYAIAHVLSYRKFRALQKENEALKNEIRDNTIEK